MNKVFIAVTTFLNATQIVYELSYASGKMIVPVYSSDTYYSSALIFTALAVWGFLILVSKETK